VDLRGPLRELFGFPDFLPGQEDVVRRALAGTDALALMPTGSGKSLPYQLAAMLRERPTLVVSPLIALMKDQVDKLPPAVAARATLVNSSLEADEVAARVRAFAAGETKLLYAAPERLRRRSFVTALASAGVGLVVVDEVHCVSMWGHDFRPDYLFIRTALAALGEPPVLGLTATATPETEKEIGRALGRSFEVVRASVVRANLHHAVDRAESEEERRRALLARLRGTSGPAIVYARSRRSCEALSRFLRGHGISAFHYHAGMEPAERTEAQEAFLRGDARVVVATTAFGMGIDKPDIRLVLLYNLPGSLEDYVQMVGRAGRDGAPSDCVLFSGRPDARSLRRFVEGDVPRVEELRDAYRSARDGLEVAEPVLLGMLEQAGLVRRGFDRDLDVPAPPADARERMTALLGQLEAQARARADRIVAFAESARCRQAEIAEHFGEQTAGDCGTCDACAGSIGVVAFEGGSDEAVLPEDVLGEILRAVGELRWPLGVSGLAATLGGSISAPPSGRRSPAFGALAAASTSRIERWIRELVDSRHLDRYESEDGFPLLRLGPARERPRAVGAEGPVDEGLFERLRTWRLAQAREADVPAFVVFSDKTLRALAAARPGDERALAAVPGIGPAKLERYGPELLQLVSAQG
jgi:RecQ family ATP-dependent DNA helicase